jgi:ParB family chromosome partitioning protein
MASLRVPRGRTWHGRGLLTEDSRNGGVAPDALAPLAGKLRQKTTVAESKKKVAKKTATKKKATRRKKAEPASRGIGAADVLAESPAEVAALAEQIAADGGTALATYREPLGGHFTIIAALPIEKVEPTPFQRDLSATHVKRLGEVIDKLDRFLDPIVSVRNDQGVYWTPNGMHRLNAMRNLGAKAIVALVVPDATVAYKILALNTEKAHNVKEKSMEVIRMARSLAEMGAEPETAYALEFEEPQFLTLGVCYEQRPRFSGGAYSSVLKRVESFLDEPLPKAIPIREARAAKLLEIDDAVAEAVKALKEKGFESPYLKAFVVARVNPIRFTKGEPGPWDEVMDKMLASAQKFDVSKVRADQVAASGGAPESE